jgi:hypothetical protein
VKSSVNDAGAGAAWSHIIGWSQSRKTMRLRQLLNRSDVQHKQKTCFKMAPRVLRPHHFYAAPGSDFGLQFWCGSGGSGAASTFLPGFLMRLLNTCLFLIVLFLTSGLAPELHLFTAPAAVKRRGSGRTERMWLRPHWKDVAPAALKRCGSGSSTLI